MKNPYRQLTVDRLVHRQRRAALNALWQRDPRAALAQLRAERERRARKRGNRLRSRYPGMGPCVDAATALRSFNAAAEMLAVSLLPAVQQWMATCEAFIEAQRPAMLAAIRIYEESQSRARSASGSAPAEGKASDG